MIYYDKLPLDKEIIEALSKLRINYVFQPIFFKDGKTIYAYEALMRPEGTTVVDLIEEYTKLDQLHILEVATFWGATQAYFLRGYKEKLTINSFPCEAFTKEETAVYINYFGSDKNILIIELLEYPKFSLDISKKKVEYAKIGNNLIALDDFGAGFNDIEKVNLLSPHIIKIDRELLSGIDQNIEKQNNCAAIIETMHARNIEVVAEGIETKEEFDYLVKLGADYFQGYYLGRPM